MDCHFTCLPWPLTSICLSPWHGGMAPFLVHVLSFLRSRSLVGVGTQQKTTQYCLLLALRFANGLQGTQHELEGDGKIIWKCGISSLKGILCQGTPFPLANNLLWNWLNTYQPSRSLISLTSRLCFVPRLSFDRCEIKFTEVPHSSRWNPRALPLSHHWAFWDLIFVLVPKSLGWPLSLSCSGYMLL